MNEGNIVIQWSKNISEEAQVKQKFFFLKVLNMFQSLGTRETKELMYKQNKNINSNMKYKNESDIPKLKRQLKI